jgi:ectoine hydroxylase-related dioxygenase (phytanoyl-CoA dioxygenase family)
MTVTSDVVGRLDFSRHIRDLTTVEVEAFRRDGVVDVPGLVSPELVAELKQHYMDWSGIRWDEWPADLAEQREFIAVIERVTTGRGLFAARQDDPWIFNYVTQPQLGKAASDLIGAPAVRIISETLHVKYPESSGHSKPLDWHQDWPHFPIDRVGSVQCWVALAPITEDMGPMVHLKGSHHEHSLGMLSYQGVSPDQVHPELWERYEVTEPHDLNPGDAVFHHGLCLHASGVNHTDRIRWGMSSYRIAANCLYTNQPNHNTDGLGLEPFKPLDHPNFPVVWPLETPS